jgi:hypothetical protein
MSLQFTARVTRKWAGVDSAWEQEKLEARKILENAAESHTSGARGVSPHFFCQKHKGAPNPRNLHATHKNNCCAGASSRKALLIIAKMPISV